MWDILYDLHGDIEFQNLSRLLAKDIMIDFPDWECNPRELEEISLFLGRKVSENYVRFLQFYNGLLLGQWLFFSANIHVSEKMNVMYMYFFESEVRKGTSSDITDKMLPIATNNDIMCYLAKTGEVFSLPWPDNKALYSREPILVSNFFEEFIDECVLGPRYLEFGKKDETYGYLQRFLKNKIKLDSEYGNDEDENPTRDPRIMTGLRRTKHELAEQIVEQTKDWPEGTKVDRVNIIKLER
jgi:hypothetical protein